MLDKFIAAFQISGGPDHRQPAADTPEAAEAAGTTGAAQPGLSDEELAALLSHVPQIAEQEPAAVRAWFDAVCSATGIPLGQVATLVTLVPAVWGRSADSLVSRLQQLAKDLGCSTGDAAALMAAVPPLYGINSSTIIKDKFDSLAMRLGLPTSTVVDLVSRQPVIWSISPRHIKSGAPRLCEQLGLSTAQAVELIARVPVVVALETGLLNLQLGALSSTLGVAPEVLMELLGRCLGLVAVPAEVLGANVTNLAAALEVRVEAVLAILLNQPMLLAAQLPSLVAAVETVQSALQLGSRADALAVVAAQPSLMYDTTPASIHEKLEGLAAVFEVPVDDMRQVAAQEPLLLAVAPFTLRNAVAAARAAGGDAVTPQQCLEVLLNDPASFLVLAFSDDQLDSWSSRLGIEEEDDVDALLEAQPALLEMAANTLKARLESLSALFEVPLKITAQLVARHPPLAAIPPNVIITRVKSLSMALGKSMQGTATVVAKAPALLVCAASGPGEMNRDLKPYLDMVSEVVAAYEFYTMEWLEKSIKEASPKKLRSFSQLDAR